MSAVSRYPKMFFFLESFLDATKFLGSLSTNKKNNVAISRKPMTRKQLKGNTVIYKLKLEVIISHRIGN